MATGTATVDLRPFHRLTKHIHDVDGPFHRAMLRWGVRNREFLQKRFARLSRGGGEWPPLKRKRKRGKLSLARVLRDTGLLLAVLSPVFAGIPGAIEKKIRKGIRIGYGGPARHRDGTVAIAQIAHWHQVGAGNLPVRKIIIPPSQRVRRLMAKDLEQAAAEV